MVNISENLEVLEGVKDDIKTAIENKGIVINDTTPFVDYATKINEISIGTGDYQDGYEQGKLDQKALLENRTFRRNGTYSRPDGYGTVVVDVPSGGTGDYDTGFEDGVAAQKAKLTNITITNNGTYTNEDGYGEVIVNVEGGSGDCEEAYEQGKADQKTLMTTATFTRNGTYTREDGYSTVVVDVADENGSYQDGYNTGIEEGKITGYNSGYTAGETAQKSKLTGITITENGTYLKDDGYNEVIVNVPQTGGTTGSLVLVDGTKLQGSTFTEIPSFYDFSEITDMSEMFYGCRKLQTIRLIDTSNVIDMSKMFVYCENLQTIPALDTSNVTSMEYMFDSCTYLTSIPELNTSNVNNMGCMFCDCNYLQTIAELDTRNVTIMNSMFYNCIRLQSLPKIYCDNCYDMRNYFSPINDISSLTDVGGWINLNCDWNDNWGLFKCPNLTYQSCINILNGLADVTELGGRTLKVHSNFLTTVGDEINIGTSKNWTITA